MFPPQHRTIWGHFRPDHDPVSNKRVSLQNIWRRILGWLDTDGDGEITAAELAALDIDGDGKISKAELRSALRLVLGLSTHGDQDTLVDLVMEAGGDRDGDGHLTVDEINT